MESTIVFMDTSALAKRYVLEPGSAYVSQFFVAHERMPLVFVSVLTYVEMIAALSRRQPPLPAVVAQTFTMDYQQGMQKVPIKVSIIDQAGTLCRVHRLRAADAIQLASALWVARRIPEIHLLTADKEMLLAAQTEGLQVADPNEHA
jgi:predicted nucleic acid-binding protein